VPVLIPEAYVPDLDVRLGLYRRLATLDQEGRAGGLRRRADRPLRPLPKEVNTLLVVVRIKAMCKRAGIARLDAGPKGATIQFHMDKFANPAGLVEFLQGRRGWPRSATTR
jgi:transcription-repair coupling factor (superfamily II helicase)